MSGSSRLCHSVSRPGCPTRSPDTTPGNSPAGCRSGSSVPVRPAVTGNGPHGGATREVARYYDANTGRFLLVGAGGGTHAIHRELWGPGVSSTAEAVDNVNGLLVELIEAGASGSPGSIVDLGCGVGGTVMRLAEAFPYASITGVTISPRQVEIARRLTRARGLEDRCRYVLGDFQESAAGTDHDAAVAVEAAVHAETPERFFTAAAHAVRPEGVLVLVDDFLARPLEALTPEGPVGGLETSPPGGASRRSLPPPARRPPRRGRASRSSGTTTSPDWCDLGVPVTG